METANLSQAARAAIKAAVPSALLPLTLARSCTRNEAERSGFSIQEYPGRVVSDVDPDRVVLKLDVLSVLVPESSAMDLAAQFAIQLSRHGCQALVTATDTKEFSYIFGEGVLTGEKNYEKEALVVFFQADSPRPLFWVRGTNGRNYELDTGKVLNRLVSWSERCEFAVLGVGYDWVELRFNTLPVDVEEFAEEIYDFCPATLDQGIVLPRLEDQETLDEPDFPSFDEGNFQGLETLEDWMDNSGDAPTTQDLARYLKRERRLYLWWD
ncbi:MAG: DUF4253 domain-containing protein [Planctomycetaceae bacterium]|nr:DUF4253 domain-containing protein [Planctomycetaceae bacterium]